MNNKPLSFDDMCDCEGKLCEYCRCTEYGLNEYKGEIKLGPNGPYSCEGNWCEEAYERYLEEFEEGEE